MYSGIAVSAPPEGSVIVCADAEKPRRFSPFVRSGNVCAGAWPTSKTNTGAKRIAHFYLILPIQNYGQSHMLSCGSD
jgi:hypothetical protein